MKFSFFLDILLFKLSYRLLNVCIMPRTSACKSTCTEIKPMTRWQNDVLASCLQCRTQSLWIFWHLYFINLIDTNLVLFFKWEIDNKLYFYVQGPDFIRNLSQVPQPRSQITRTWWWDTRRHVSSYGLGSKRGFVYFECWWLKSTSLHEKCSRRISGWTGKRASLEEAHLFLMTLIVYQLFEQLLLEDLGLEINHYQLRNISWCRKTRDFPVLCFVHFCWIFSLRFANSNKYFIALYLEII